MEEGGTEAVIAAMQAFVESEYIQAYGRNALQSCFIAGGIKATLAAIQAKIGNHSAKVGAYYALSIHFSRSTIVDVAATMQARVNDAEVQVRGIESLCDRAVLCGPGSGLFCKGYKYIWSVLVCNFTESLHGVAALKRSTRLGKESCHRVAEGGIGHVVRAMQRHANIGDVQTEGSDLLKIIARTGRSRRVAEEGGIGAIIQCMERFRQCKDVQITACQALLSMIIRDGADIASRIKEEGGIRVVDIADHRADQWLRDWGPTLGDVIHSGR